MKKDFSYIQKGTSACHRTGVQRQEITSWTKILGWSDKEREQAGIGHLSDEDIQQKIFQAVEELEDVLYQIDKVNNLT